MTCIQMFQSILKLFNTFFFYQHLLLLSRPVKIFYLNTVFSVDQPADFLVRDVVSFEARKSQTHDQTSGLVFMVMRRESLDPSKIVFSRGNPHIKRQQSQPFFQFGCKVFYSDISL